MSVSASIKIIFSKNRLQEISSSEMLLALIQSGWIFNNGNGANFIPFGDKDSSDWRFEENINLESLLKIFRKKELCGEQIGLDMTWENSAIGGSFQFWKNETITININNKRQRIVLLDDYEITDFNWYLKRLLPSLNNTFGVEYFSCEEF